MIKKLYHITKPGFETLTSISDEGLKCNEEGEIFLFENTGIKSGAVSNYVADIIAVTQENLNSYSMFEIDIAGIEGPLIQFDAPFFVAQFQWIAKQEVIKPEFIQWFGFYDNEYIPFRNYIGSKY